MSHERNNTPKTHDGQGDRWLIRTEVRRDLGEGVGGHVATEHIAEGRVLEILRTVALVVIVGMAHRGTWLPRRGGSCLKPSVCVAMCRDPRFPGQSETENYRHPRVPPPPRGASLNESVL